MFDFANNTFLSSVNVKSLMLVGIYQTLENIISVIFNLLVVFCLITFKENGLSF